MTLIYCQHCGVNYWAQVLGGDVCPACKTPRMGWGGGSDGSRCESGAGGAADTEIEYAAFENLEAERDALKAKLAALDRDHADDWKRIQDAERKLAEVEAENRALNELVEKCREKNMEQLNWNIDKANELRREREAAKVMRGAMEQIQSLAANEHEQGDSKALDDVLDLTCETFKALAKADEIRGKE